MSEYLSDDQLERLFRTNLPNRPAPPDLAERITKLVLAEVALTIKPQQPSTKYVDVAKQIVTAPIPSTRARNSGKHWLFPKGIGRLASTVAAFAAVFLLAVLFSQSALPAAIQRLVAIFDSTGPVSSETATIDKIPTATDTSTIEPTAKQNDSEATVTPTDPTNNATEADPEATVNSTEQPTNTPTRSMTAQTSPSATVIKSTATATAIKGSSTSEVKPSPTATNDEDGLFTPVATATATKRAEATTTSQASASKTATADISPTPTSDSSGSVTAIRLSPTWTPSPVSSLSTATPTKISTVGIAPVIPTIEPSPSGTVQTGVLPTATPWRTPSRPTSTATKEIEPTATTLVDTPILPTATNTALSTATAIDMDTPLAIATNTNTPFFTATPLATSTLQSTSTPQPTLTSTLQSTSTPQPTSTLRPTSTLSPTPVNLAPAAHRDVTVSEEDVVSSINVLDNDSDPNGDLLSIVGVSDPINGSTRIQGNIIFYEPNQNYSGPDSFVYQISDGSATVVGQVDVTVLPVNDPPIPAQISNNINEDETAFIDISGYVNDPDSNGVQLVRTSNPTHGTAIIVGSSIQYRPNPNFSGQEIFSYVVSDGQEEATNLIYLEVRPVNDPLIARDSFLQIDEDGSIKVNWPDNFSDEDSSNISIVETGGAQYGTVVNNGDGVIYTPSTNYNGEDSFYYRASDGNTTATATVRLKVMPVNDPPEIRPIQISTAEGIAVHEDVINWASDPDGDQLRVESVENGAHGSATIAGRNIFYQPYENYVGSDEVRFTISDGQSGVSGLMIIVISGVNDPPTANDISAVLGLPETARIETAGQIFDVDGDALNVSVSNVPGELRVDVDVDGKTILVTPLVNSGSFSFQYTVSDGSASTTGTVNVVLQLPEPTATNTEEPPTSTQTDTPTEVQTLDVSAATQTDTTVPATETSTPTVEVTATDTPTAVAG